MKKIITSYWFNIVSWAVTALIVASLLASAFWYVNNPFAAVSAAPKTAPETLQAIPTSSAIDISLFQLPAIQRNLTLKTIIPTRPRYDVIKHTVQRGDAISLIAKEFNIKPDTLLFSNYDVLEDSPDSLQPGQELNIPPTDGLLYKWQDGDTLDKIAAQYKAKLDDILHWPGNNIDLTDPIIKIGQLIMLPGATRESRAQVIQTAGGGGGSTGCPGSGNVGRGFFGWPAANHFLSGNDYSAGHPGIDIAVSEGENIYAADSGVVIMAQGGWNYGYGNVIEINHGKGFVTLYAHLSAILVGKCDNVGAGQVIGSAGNTGNSFGTHLHFEIRLNGTHVNPWDYLP
ncbi:MAG: peptidoglycan DD-metalloendopeptidase family protein [Anaerolineales bacterium]